MNESISLIRNSLKTPILSNLESGDLASSFFYIHFQVSVKKVYTDLEI